jgi:hypothetical protein
MEELACGLPGGSSDVGRDDVGGVAVEGGAGPVVSHRGPWISMGGGLLDIAQVHPASIAAVMNAWRSVRGPTGLVIPARRAVRRTIHLAPCRSSRRPSGVRKTGPSVRPPMARSIARAVRGAERERIEGLGPEEADSEWPAYQFR